MLCSVANIWNYCREVSVASSVTELSDVPLPAVKAFSTANRMWYLHFAQSNILCYVMAARNSCVNGNQNY